MLTAFIMAKIIALKLGPEGLGLIGQLNSFVLIVMTLSTGAITNGVVKYIAQFNNDTKQQSKVIGAAISITLICTLLLSLVVGLGATFWSSYVFNGNTSYYSVFVLFGATLFFYASYNLFVSILNGFQQYKTYNILNVSTGIVGLLFTVALIYKLGIMGALYATVTYQSVVFIGLLFLVKNKKWIQFKNLFQFNDKGIYKGLLSFSAMSLVSTLCVPYVQILIRKYIDANCGAINMGYYEGITRISTLYLTLITTTLSVYYLPRLSEITGKAELKKEIWQGYKIILPSLLVFCAVMFLSRTLIVKLVFSDAFTPMVDFFLPQLIGDVLKIASWLLAFLMLAKAMTKQFIVTEIVFSVTLYTLTLLLVNYFGAIGAVYAYTVNYLLYLITMVVLFRKTIL